MFELIAERYERRSLITTCNQTFSAWDQILPDPAITAAPIDRLVHALPRQNCSLMLSCCLI